MVSLTYDQAWIYSISSVSIFIFIRIVVDCQKFYSDCKLGSVFEIDFYTIQSNNKKVTSLVPKESSYCASIIK